MGVFLYRKKPDGSLESAEVPHEQLRDALAGGEWQLPAGRIPVISPDGKEYTLPAENALKALDTGFRLSGREEAVQKAYGGAKGIAQTAGAAAARALSFSASDAFLKASGVSAQRLRDLEEANPVANIGATIGAFVASTAAAPEATAGKILGAGPRAAGALGRAVDAGVSGALLRSFGSEAGTVSLAKTALAKMTGHIAGGAAEAVPYALGEVAHQGIVHEKNLGDPEVLAEVVASDVLPMVVFGGAIGGVTGAIGDLAGPALRKLSGKIDSKLGQKIQGLPDELEQRVGYEAARAVDADAAYAKKFAGQKGRAGSWRKEFADVMLDQNAMGDGKAIIEGGNILQNQKRLVEYWEKIGDGYKSLFNTSDRLNSVWKQPGEVAAEAAGSMTNAGAKPGFKMPMGEMPERIGPSVDRIEKEIRDKVLPKMLREADSANAESFINKRIMEAREKIQGWQSAHEYQISLGNRSFDGDVAKIIRAEIRRSFKAGAPQLHGAEPGKRAVDLLDALDRNYWAIGDIAKAARARMGIPVGGGVDFGKVMGGAGIRSLAWNIPQVLTGKLIIPLMRAVGAGGAAALARGIGGAGDPAAMAQILSRKAASLKSIQGKTEALQSLMTNSIQNFLGVGRAAQRISVPTGVEFMRQMTGEKDTRKAVKKFVMETAKRHADPAAVADQIAAYTSPFAGDAPEITARAATKMATAIARIHEKMPKPPLANSMQPMLDVEEHAPNRTLATSAADYITGVTRPDIALGNIARMTASKDMVNGATDAHPRLMQLFWQQLAEEVALQPKRIDPKKANYVAIRMAGITGPTSRQTFVQGSQQFLMATPDPKKGQQTPSLKGLASSDNMLLSGAQRTETIT